MKIALELFGQFRSYSFNLKPNLDALLSQLPGYEIDVFIMSENKNEESEADVISILSKYKQLNLKKLYYFENMPEEFQNQSKLIQKTFNADIDEKLGEDYRLNHLAGYHEFTKELMYRKSLLHDLVYKISSTYDFYISARLFDVSFSVMKPFDFLPTIKENDVYHSIDTFFIAKGETLRKLLSACYRYKIKEMNTPDFRRKLREFDDNLNGCFPFLCSELITLKTLEDGLFNHKNIRYNFTAVEIAGEPKEKHVNYVDIRLCSLRHQNLSKLAEITIGSSNIVSCTYGNDELSIDATTLVKSNMGKMFIVNNAFFCEDPLPGVPKVLSIQTKDGETQTFREGTVLKLF